MGQAGEEVGSVEQTEPAILSRPRCILNSDRQLPTNTVAAQVLISRIPVRLGWKWFVPKFLTREDCIPGVSQQDARRVLVPDRRDALETP